MSRARVLALLALATLAVIWSARRSAHTAAAGPEPARRAPPPAPLPTRLGVAAPPPCCAHSIALELSFGETLDLGREGALFASYAADLAWPLPDELPESVLEHDPVVLGLQELLGAEDGDRDAILDELDSALLEPAATRSPWSRLSRIEAERQLEIARHEDDLLDHTDALVRWADQGGQGPLPPVPEPRATEALAHSAADLADDLGTGRAADLARLTAAAAMTDWNGSSFDEEGAAELLLDVVWNASDPEQLAAATDMLVGLHVPLPPESLDLLAELGPELGPAERLRLEWFLTQQRTALGQDHDARRNLEQALQAGAELERADAPTLELLHALRQARGPLLARTGGQAEGLEEAVLAAAQTCVDRHLPGEERLHLAFTPDGLHTLVGEGLVAGCLRGELAALAGPEGGVEVLLELRPLAD